MVHDKKLIVSATGTEQFAEKISEITQIPWIRVDTTQFPNEESRIKVEKAGETTYLLGSLSRPVNARIIEYLLAADAIKRLGCQHIVGILSWYAYSKQDKVFSPGEPLSAKVIASLLQDVSIKELHTLELHNPSIAGYFEIPVTNHSAMELFVKYVNNLDLTNTIVVSPDAGSIKNSFKIAELLNLPIAHASKKRDLDTGEVTITEVNKDISGQNILIFDDMIASGSTLIELSEFLKQRGAKKITVCCTHHLFLENVQEKLDNSAIDSVIVTNSIDAPPTLKSNKLTTIDIAPLLANSITRIE